MSSLVPVTQSTVNGETVLAVNARDLHKFLENKQKFTTWIQKRIADYGFSEGSDFTRFDLSVATKMAETTGGGIAEIVNSQKSEALESTGCIEFGQQGRIEYAITIEMAKELAMVERNQKGKEARQYFIACEKQLKEQQILLLPEELLVQQAQMLLEQKKEMLRLEEKQKALQAQVEQTNQRLDQIETGIDHFTIIGYARTFLKKSLPLKDAAKLGRQATNLCMAMGIAMGTVPDPRFGNVHTYPKSVLDEVCH
jgi:phage anti-repressor protein